MHKARVGLDKAGKIIGWDHRVAVKSIMKGAAFESLAVKDGIDHSSVEGVADTLYRLPNMSTGLSDLQTTIPVLWWRSVGHTHTAYVMESLIDMVAHESGQANWKAGDKRGFAVHLSFNSFVVVVADVSVDGDKLHVNDLQITVDCGVVVNLDVIRAQMEGGAGYGLGRYCVTRLRSTRVRSSNPIFRPMSRCESLICPASTCILLFRAKRQPVLASRVCHRLDRPWRMLFLPAAASALHACRLRAVDCVCSEGSDMSNQLSALLQAWQDKRDDTEWVLGTVYRTTGSSYRKACAMMINGFSQYFGMLSGGCLEADILRHARRVMQSGEVDRIRYDGSDEDDWSYQLGIGCGGCIDIVLHPLRVDNPLGLAELSTALSQREAGSLCLSLSAVEGYFEPATPAT
jgi:hypothetical protein